MNVMRSLVAALAFAGVLIWACSGGDQPIEFNYPITGNVEQVVPSTSVSRKPAVGSTSDTDQDLQACIEFEGANPGAVREHFDVLDPEDCP